MLKETINNRWKEAFINKDADLKSAFESVKAKILVEEKSGKYTTLPLTDDVIVAIIMKEVKELKETQSYYKVGDDMYAKIQRKLDALADYLPKQMSEENVKQIVRTLHTKETNKGKLIGMTVKEVGNRFDKSIVAKIVNDVLSE